METGKMRHIYGSAIVLAVLALVVLMACGGPQQPPMAQDCSEPSQLVNIPDAAMLQAVRDELGIPTGGISCAAMADLESLNAFNAGIIDLEGMQHARNVSDLSFSANEISDVTPLSGLTSLVSLNLNANFITDVGPLENLTNLESLYVCCPLEGTISDVDPLSSLNKLEILHVEGHQLGDDAIWPLIENFPAISGLYIGDNDLTDLTPLTDHPELRLLSLANSDITDLAPVAALPKLVTLDLWNSSIADFTPLHSMTQLEILELSSVGLSDISFLEDLVNLKFLFLRGNEITSLAPLVANLGIGDGDLVDVRSNPLDLEDSGTQADIQALVDRGVEIRY